DTFNRCFVLFQSREATQNSRQNNHWGRTQQRLTFLLSAVFYDTALEQTGRSGQNGVTRFGFFLVTHAQVTARTLQVQLVFVLGAGSFFRVVVIEDEASVFRQNVPIAFGFQLVNDVVRRWGCGRECWVRRWRPRGLPARRGARRCGPGPEAGLG